MIPTKVPCIEHIHVQNSLNYICCIIGLHCSSYSVLEQMVSINRWTIGIHDSVWFFSNTSKILSLTDLNYNRQSSETNSARNKMLRFFLARNSFILVY